MNEPTNIPSCLKNSIWNVPLCACVSLFMLCKIVILGALFYCLCCFAVCVSHDWYWFMITTGNQTTDSKTYMIILVFNSIRFNTIVLWVLVCTRTSIHSIPFIHSLHHCCSLALSQFPILTWPIKCLMSFWNTYLLVVRQSLSNIMDGACDYLAFDHFLLHYHVAISTWTFH